MRHDSVVRRRKNERNVQFGMFEWKNEYDIRLRCTSYRVCWTRWCVCVYLSLCTTHCVRVVSARAQPILHILRLRWTMQCTWIVWNLNHLICIRSTFRSVSTRFPTYNFRHIHGSNGKQKKCFQKWGENNGEHSSLHRMKTEEFAPTNSRSCSVEMRDAKMQSMLIGNDGMEIPIKKLFANFSIALDGDWLNTWVRQIE